MSIGTVSLLLLLFLFLIGAPVALALIICVIPYFLATDNVPAYMVIQKVIAQTESTSLLAIPFFILAGAIMNHSGITKRLMAVAEIFVGHLRGGLGHVNVVLSALMGGMTGSCAADAALDCKILVPEMLKRNYDKPFSAAVTAASSIITTIIPPGIGLIVYAYAANVSVGRIFTAGYIPGLILMVLQMLLVAFLAKQRKYPPSREKRATFKEIWPVLKEGLWALFLPFGLILGLRFGVFNATEGGAMCVLYGLIVGLFVYKDMKIKHLPVILKEAVLSTSAVMLVMCAANVFSFYLSWENIPQTVSNFLINYANNRYILLLGVIIIFLFIGMFMDGTTVMMIVAPIIAPVAASLGIDLVQLGILMVMLCSLGTITPPFGVIIYLVAPLIKIRVEEFLKEVWWFICVVMVGVLLVAFIPEITTFLPNLLFGK